ncbi:hypothetical protein [Zunongwangia profunda]|tara:strand:- start:2087 stop:2614 length:528 start_codon:yes stop_codon:yes gene_type:complete
MKKLIFINFMFLVLFPILCSSQQTNLEQKAVKYLCENLGKIDNDLLNKRIYFNGNIIRKTSNIYNVANCNDEINLIKNEIPIEKEKELDSIANHNLERQYESKKIVFDCNSFSKKRRLFTEYYYMRVYNFIEYDNKYSVEINISGKKGRSVEIIIVNFDKSSKDVSHCYKHLIYD